MENEEIEHLGDYDLKEHRFNIAFVFRQGGNIVEIGENGSIGENKGYIAAY